jgi:2-succinyl-6-hydroxy-2,4-cyclohexadiene-1-carboxylate synthase
MKVVLALHGFLGLPSDWSEIQQEFHRIQDEYKLVPVDYMNLRGLTPDVPLERWGENFCLWAERNFPRVKKVVAGYSLGGRLALHAFHSKPAMWSQAFFLSTDPGLKSDVEKKTRRESDQRWAQRFQNVDFESVVREWNAQPVFENCKKEPVRLAKDYDSEILAKAISQWSPGRQQDFSDSEILKTYPSLWLAGQLDPKFVSILENLVSTCKCLESKIITESSHRLLIEQPASVAQCFYEKLKPTKPSLGMEK